ncbi:3-oxoacyl-[acyl-carrier-protein] reductase [Bacillus sp. FJAT-47783]|uniref:3-oxoacyl-[acyl-carrier-protein] reductase n=1 Tax=Bacillus sp. FJAT-47783 TaxID=2922712 RepID=UPI001FAD480A|nr:3-oxoacyl-[acyl-carrier-protein] reductase [Bacillus sp. FJAT-47783]
MSMVESNIVEKNVENKQLEGKVAIVTGGSRGIGSEIAKVLATHGATVVINYNNSPEAADNVVTEIMNTGGKAVAMKANVADLNEAKSLVEETKERFGKIDILVNNAGITRDRTFKKMSEEDWKNVIDVNLTSVYQMTSSVIHEMLEQKWGRIINISSIIGQAGGFGQSNYSAAKAGMIGFTKSLALETARKGITVNAICPGFIETEMVAAMPDNVLQQTVNKIPVGRLGQPKEIAEAVLFLTQSEYITGQCINVNGGLYM